MLISRIKMRINNLYPNLQKSRLLSFDVGFNEIRLLQLQKSASGFHIEKILSQPFSEIGLEKDRSWQAVQASLSRLVLQHQLTGCWAAFTFPAIDAIKKQVELPGYFNESEIAHELSLRSSQYFPGLKEAEIYTDFAIQSTTEDRHQVLWVAARKEQLYPSMQAFTKAHLKPQIIDLDVYALARVSMWALRQQKQAGVVILLDLRWPLFSFLGLCKDKLLFYHQWHVSQAEFVDLLAVEAHFMQQIKNIGQLFQSQVQMEFKSFMLSGSIPHLTQIAQKLEQTFSLPVNIINPFEWMTAPPSLSIETLYALAAPFLLCCGLALRGL